MYSDTAPPAGLSKPQCTDMPVIPKPVLITAVLIPMSLDETLTVMASRACVMTSDDPEWVVEGVGAGHAG